jgi:hypothetical protein
VVEEQYPDGFPADFWNQSPPDGLFHHQPDGPAGTPLRRITANHRDDALFLAVIQHFGCSRPLLLEECAFEAALFISMADLANRLWRQWDNRGNPRGTDALGQLRKRHGAENDSHLLHAAAQQFSKFLPVLGCDRNTQGWTGHALSMRQNISE